MTIISLDLKTAFACPCKPGEKECPYCRGEEGSIPVLNRAAILRASEILKSLEIPALRLIGMGYLPGSAASQGKRFCAGPLDTANTAFLAEGKNGEALLVLTSADPSGLTMYTQVEILPGDVLCTLPDAFYPAMDLPPIEL